MLLGIHGANVVLDQQHITELKNFPISTLLAMDHQAQKGIFNNSIIRSSGKQLILESYELDEFNGWQGIFAFQNEPDWLLPNSWVDGIWTYRYYLKKQMNRIKTMGFTLSPTLSFPLYNAEQLQKCYVFNAICKDVFNDFSAIGIHLYSGNTLLDGRVKDHLTYLKREYPNKKFYITELGHDPNWKGNRFEDLKLFYDYLKNDSQFVCANYFIQNRSYNWKGFELGEDQNKLATWIKTLPKLVVKKEM